MSVTPSQQCKYALLAMAYLVRQKPDRLVPICEIADNIDVAASFLAKILARLSRNGLLASRRGPSGGVRLARRPGDIKLSEPVRLFDGPRERRVCYLGLQKCDGRRACPMHTVWGRVHDEVDRTLGARTVDDLRRVRLGLEPKRRSRPKR